MTKSILSQLKNNSIKLTYKSNSCIIHTHFTLRGYSSRNIPNFRKCVYFYILPEYTCTIVHIAYQLINLIHA